MLEHTIRTHPGCIRKKNEDSYYVSSVGGKSFFAVADGMGGHAAGEVASFLAIETLQENISMHSSSLSFYDPVKIKSFLSQAILQANENILMQQMRKPEQKGMGTTLTVSVFLDDEFLTAHVGDSQVHLFNVSGHYQVTEDHSVVMELLKNKEIDLEDIYDHPRRNILTRSLGTTSPLKIDFYATAIQENDYILLCTDGLTNMLRPNEIQEIIFRSTHLEGAADQLLAKANALGGLDNITFVLIQYKKGES
ncbi:MAG: Stp1/IreP family PP2C-type Ser/Thr phosphatase [Firmicutes bacterium]|nr:Stp1/IreP family PP2C-type Ser/Thr phosphatase [Bacillota bacterium]